MKIIIFSHGHPVFSKGGGEFAAYFLHKGLDQMSGHASWFIGRGQPEVMHKFAQLACMGERDYLLAGNANLTDLNATIPLGGDSDLAQLLVKVKPDVVHFHHYVHLGIETIRLVKKCCPNAKIVVTLHEYIAICRNNGQMVKTSGELCYNYSPRECHLCFPHVSPEDIFLREQYIKSFFRLVDQFISPSEFLRQRYIDWGLDSEKICVVENGLPAGEKVPPRPLIGEDVRGRFAYFGQINPYKGVDVVLEAFASLSDKHKELASLDIYGSGLQNQEPAFQERINRHLTDLGSTARFHGSFEQQELPRLMAEVDWVVMGSVWWENSPLVIQEAYKFGRPVICPDIGGMAEKVKPGIGGLNFRARDSVSLASTIERALTESELYDNLCKTLPEYPRISAIVEKHIEIYNGEVAR